jgi:DMSO/TMAO reductase YedYZ molybdopterin-dependent catalytic subunit
VNRARLRALAAAACAVWASCACPVLAQTVADAKFVRSEIRVGGNVERVLVLSVEDLQRIPVQHLEERRIVGAPGNGTESLRRFTGCRLRDVLDAAVLTERTRRDLRRSYVVAAASDGYEVVFSWGELYNSPAGDGVLVVYAIDGAPLPDGEGRIALVSLNDTRPGPRHVKWLARIDVRQASN